jgi:hypothetical protein
VRNTNEAAPSFKSWSLPRSTRTSKDVTKERDSKTRETVEHLVELSGRCLQDEGGRDSDLKAAQATGRCGPQTSLVGIGNLLCIVSHAVTAEGKLRGEVLRVQPPYQVC